MERIFFACLSALFCCAFCFSQDAQHRESDRAQLSELSSEIHGTLDGLRKQSNLLKEQLAKAEYESERQFKEAARLKIRLGELSTSLSDTNELLADYSTKLTEYETELKRRAKIIAAWTGVLVAFVAVRVILALLMIKYGIKIPYWLNLLL